MAGVKAKEASKWFQIFGAVWIFAMATLKGFGIVTGLTVFEIVVTGVAAPLALGGVLASILIEKLKGATLGEIKA